MMDEEPGPPRLSSALALFRMDSSQSIRALKMSELRPETRSSFGGTGRLRAISRVTWGSVFRGLRSPKEQQSTVLGEFQQKIHLNSDTFVAAFELAIVLLSCVQLELSARSPRWRENKVCERLSSCVNLRDEGSFAVPNLIRTAIGLLGIIRFWIRIRFLFKHRHVMVGGISWFKRTAACRMYVLEVLGVVIFPYPGLELILKRSQADVMVFLSIAVGVRTICWRHILYFPYPIRQKEKVATFSGNLEFSYREFVFKKVMDDRPITKITMVVSILLVFTSFLVRAIETINCVCAPTAAFAASGSFHAHHLVCEYMSWDNALWLVSTSFVMLGFGDVVPKSKAGRSLIAVTACVMRCLAAMLASVIIKKFNFSSMEARVHAFLFRMDLFNQKDVSAVIAVQATFRFNKSYKRSLMWHKHQSSQLYYRPLSARLPNEMKKKLYVARFQASLKEIMKFNTDGDPLNAFAKHIEVITAALGITLVEMAQLKKVYWRKNRMLEERQKLAQSNSYRDLTAETAMTITVPSASTAAVVATSGVMSSPEDSAPSSPRGSDAGVPASNLPPRSRKVAVSPEWGKSMLFRCEQVLAQLQDLERSARNCGFEDRSSEFVRADQSPSQNRE